MLLWLGDLNAFIPFYCIIDQEENLDQEEDLSNKELLLNIRRMQDFMMKQQHSIDVLSAPAPEGNQYSKL